MLQKLNERVQGIVAWLIIFLIAITFTLFGIDYYLQSHQTSDAKVLVNNQAISNQSFEANYRRSRSRIESALNSAADEKRLQNQVLKEMIKNEVTVQAAHHFGFDVSPTQASNAILNVPQFQEDGHFSSQRYQQVLNASLYTPETFQKEVQQGMLINQQRFAFIGSSFALASEIDRFVRLYMQKRDYDFLTISPSLFVKEIKPSEADIQNYYNGHEKEFFTPEQVSLDYINLSMKDIKDKMTIGDEEVHRYYTENKQNFLTPAQWKIAHILFAVPEMATASEVKEIQDKAQKAYEKLQKNPELFTEMVGTLSDDKLSKALNGTLPWITAGQKEYDKILSTLTQPGQILPPQRTKHGFELFKLVEYKPVGTKSLEDMASTIKEQLINDKAQTKYTKALEQLSDLSYQTPDSLTPVAEALKLPIQKTESFSRAGGTTPLTKMKQVINTAFNHEVLDLNNNSEPIQLSNDAVIVIRVNQHIPAKKQPLESVKNQIEAKLIQEKSVAMAKDLGSQLLSLTDENKQTEIMNRYQLKWTPVLRASRDNGKAQLNEVAFGLLKPGSIDGITLANGDFAVLKLKQINEGKLDSLEKELKDSLVQQIEASYGMLDYDLYVNSLVNHAKIENKNTSRS